jgi:hypothetical protein
MSCFSLPRLTFYTKTQGRRKLPFFQGETPVTTPV